MKFGCPLGSSLPGTTIAMLGPKSLIIRVTSAFTPMPMATNSTTDPTPMIMPSIVSADRSQFSRIARSALARFSGRLVIRGLRERAIIRVDKNSEFDNCQFPIRVEHATLGIGQLGIGNWRIHTNVPDEQEGGSDG